MKRETLLAKKKESDLKYKRLNKEFNSDYDPSDEEPLSSEVSTIKVIKNRTQLSDNQTVKKRTTIQQNESKSGTINSSKLGSLNSFRSLDRNKQSDRVSDEIELESKKIETIKKKSMKREISIKSKNTEVESDYIETETKKEHNKKNIKVVKSEINKKPKNKNDNRVLNKNVNPEDNDVIEI